MAFSFLASRGATNGDRKDDRTRANSGWRMGTPMSSDELAFNEPHVANFVIEMPTR